MSGQSIPIGLVAEGRMMLQALLEQLKAVPNMDILLPLDARCQNLALPPSVRIFPVAENASMEQWLPVLLDAADAVWPIAPETGGVLYQLAKQTEDLGKTLLLSDSKTVALCGNKLATYRHLTGHGITAVASRPLNDEILDGWLPGVVKPLDGVSCEGATIVRNEQEWAAARAGLTRPEEYLIQPLLKGQSASLSCLFKRGRGWQLSYNLQHVTEWHGGFRLEGCTVNADHPPSGDYQTLIDRIAQALPGLWGYVGIDLIESPEVGTQILEINPRLTTSFAGLSAATGINVVEQTLKLLIGEADYSARFQRPITITIR